MSLRALSISPFSELSEYHHSSGATYATSIDSITPDHGSALGGTSVVIVFTQAIAPFITSVTFDGVPGTGRTVLTPYSLSVVAPAGAVGAIDVVAVCAAFGNGTAAGGYTYDNAVNIASILPATGTHLGNTTVAITFDEDVAADVASVTFDGNDATNITVTAPNAITCKTPAGSAGAVDVVVDAGDRGSDTATSGFTYT